MEINNIYNIDCIIGLQDINDGSVDAVITDIPYGEVNKHAKKKRSEKGSKKYRISDKGKADVVTFDLEELTRTLCRKARGSVYMFCGSEQLSQIRQIMELEGLTTRVIVWEKTNPSPLAGEYMWLSGIELCVFGRKKGATFNYFCRNSVIRLPSTQTTEKTIHPTQKPVDLMRTLLLASTKEGDLVLDPFMGSGTTAVACIKEKRNYIGFELCEEFYKKACKRIKAEAAQTQLF